MSNIKFYTENLAEFSLTSVTNEATGYEKELMLDRRLATYWKASTDTTDIEIKIDLGSARAVDYVLLRHNPGAGFSITIYADTNSDYSTEQNIVGVSSPSATDSWTTSIYDFTQTSTYRYWKIKFTNLSAYIKVATIFIGIDYEITVRYNYGCIVKQKDFTGVKLLESYGGQCGASRQSEPRDIWRFYYEILDNTNKEKLESVLTIINGCQYPFYYTDPDDAIHYVRWITKGLNAIEFTHQLYNTGEILLKQELGSPS